MTTSVPIIFYELLSSCLRKKSTRFVRIGSLLSFDKTTYRFHVGALFQLGPRRCPIEASEKHGSDSRALLASLITAIPLAGKL